MRRLFVFAAMLAVGLWCGATAGCSSETTTTTNTTPPDVHVDEHGPHDGMLVDLEDGYHAELCLDDKTETVTVYILDKDKKETPVDAKEVVLEFVVNEKPYPFTLPAVGASDDGKASKFEKSDQGLAGSLESKDDLKPKLKVTIAGEDSSVSFKFHHH
ncbi:MAG: hypothetical protein HYS13_25400 [Planctomycetia bacterium]|nr:hypothetical protein [Planctomycetia bacterium]